MTSDRENGSTGRAVGAARRFREPERPRDRQAGAWKEAVGEAATARFLSREIRPGFSASGFDVEYKIDTELKVEGRPSIFCGVMTSKQSADLEISGVGDVEVRPYCPLLVSFSDRRACVSKYRAGARCIGAGCTITPECLEGLMAEYEEGAFDALMQAFKSGMSVRHLPQSKRLLAIAARLLENPYEGALSDLHIEGCMLSFIAEISNILQDETRSFSQSGLSAREYDRAHSVRQILEENLIETPSLAELSRLVGVNSTTMSNQFRQLFGVTIFKYVRDRRLELAQTLLRTENVPVSQVGYRVGFNNPGAFATAYRRQFGHAPSEERVHLH